MPSVVTKAHGRFWAKVDRQDRTIEYKLTYSGADSPVTQAHIHLGESKTNGGIVVYLCQTDAFPDPAGLAPPCGIDGVEGVITADSILGPSEQGIDAGEIGKLVHAMRHRATYVNVHTETFASGEFRGQIK